MNYPHNKAARLAQLDKQIIDRVKEIQQLIKPGENRACYYLSNLRDAGNDNELVAAAVGHPGILEGLLLMHGESNSDILDALPIARQALVNARR